MSSTHPKQPRPGTCYVIYLRLMLAWYTSSTAGGQHYIRKKKYNPRGDYEELLWKIYSNIMGILGGLSSKS